MASLFVAFATGAIFNLTVLPVGLLGKGERLGGQNRNQRSIREQDLLFTLHYEFVTAIRCQRYIFAAEWESPEWNIRPRREG